MKNNLFLTLQIGILLALSVKKAEAQSYLGVHNSNYAGTMGLDIQPASFVDGRFIADINLASVNVGAWTNVAKFNTRDMPGWWIKSFRDETAWQKPDSTFVDRYILDNYSLGSKRI